MATNNLFTDDQLDLIRDIFAERLEQYPKSSNASEVLDVINACQRQLGGAEFSDVAQFLTNKSNNWNEIIEDEDDLKESDFEAAKAVAAYMNEHPDCDWSTLCQVATEHHMRVFDYSDDTYFRNDEYVVFRASQDKYSFESIDHYDEDHI